VIVAPDEILEAKEVAKMLKVHVRTITRLAEKGEIIGFRVGDLWRFRKEAVEEYIKKQEDEIRNNKPQQ
jgi:excisionase family DNA binding protein